MKTEINDASFSSLKHTTPEKIKKASDTSNFRLSFEEREIPHVQTHYVGKAGVSTNFNENPHTQTYHASYAGVYTTLDQTSPGTNISL